MAILDELTPRWYEVLRLGIQQQDSDVVAVYDIAIRNVLGNRMAIINRGSALTTQEKQAVAAIYRRDEAQFEAATGLEKWIEPTEEMG